MKQTTKITVITVENDLEKSIKSVENDISKLKLMLADKMNLLERLQKTLEEVKGA